MQKASVQATFPSGVVFLFDGSAQRKAAFTVPRGSGAGVVRPLCRPVLHILQVDELLPELSYHNMCRLPPRRLLFHLLSPLSRRVQVCNLPRADAKMWKQVRIMQSTPLLMLCPPAFPRTSTQKRIVQRETRKPRRLDLLALLVGATGRFAEIARSRNVTSVE